MPEFIFDLTWRGDGVGHLLAQDISVTFPQTVKGLLDGVLAHSQFARDLRLRRAVGIVRQLFLEALEECSLPARAKFILQPRQHLVEHAQGPASFVYLIGGQVAGGFWLAPLMGQNLIERNRLFAFTPFDRACPVPLVGEKMFQRNEQVGSEMSLLAPDRIEVLALQEAREEFLGQILRFLRPVAFPPDESIKGSPITAAKLIEGLLGRGGGALGRQHDAPARGEEGGATAA